MGQSTNGKKFELVLASENVGVWMSINNAFTFDWSDSGRSKRGRGPHQTDAYWNGVLFQFGRFWAAENDLLMDGFDTIAWIHSGSRRSKTPSRLGPTATPGPSL